MKKNSTLNPNPYTLRIGWMYPELMSTYGDRGNIIVLKKRCEWRGIKTEIVNIDQNTTQNDLKSVNILFGGGAQDIQQNIVMDDLKKKKKQIKELIENNVPTLLVCGAPQLFGEYYEPSFGVKIEGLGILDMFSVHPGPKKDRLIGNVVAKVLWENLDHQPSFINHHSSVVGFENHGGRTYLGKSAKSFARIIKGYGNNGEDKSEGVVYKNTIGSYLHGPLLPKNPEIADWLIQKALEVKYKKNIDLLALDDTLEKKARETIAKIL